MSGTPDRRISESVQNASQHTGTEKRCSKCGEVKTVDNFYRDARRKRGFYSACKVCHNAVKILKRAIAAANRPARVKKPNERERKRLWRKNNPEKYKAKYMRADKKRYSTASGRLSKSIACSIRIALHGTKNGAHWEDIVGYSTAQLKRHLEKQFTPEMNWENYGSYWQIDHKIPIAAFNYEKPEDIDFLRCWHLKNLRPLEKIENIKKGAKIDKPFQPSLTL